MSSKVYEHCLVGMPYKDFLTALICVDTSLKTDNDEAYDTLVAGLKENLASGTPAKTGLGLYVMLGNDLAQLLEAPVLRSLGPLPDVFDAGAFTKPKGDKTLDKVLSFIEDEHSRQSNVFSFFLFCNADYFRVIRVDQDGLIVTERMTCKRLSNFFQRFDGLSPAQRGYDATVRDVSQDSDEAGQAREALKPFISTSQQIEPIREMGVPTAHEGGDGLRWYHIWAPTIQQTRLLSRATRGYPAWDPADKKVVWIKDSWRALDDDLFPESETLRQLNAKGVQFSPTLFCGGDLPGQRTRTHEFVDALWAREFIERSCNNGLHRMHHPRIHHRLAETYGRPLWEFESSKHLLQILHDAFTCHRMAVSKCRKLHRDLSAWNLLYDPKSKRGILTDWDLCAPMPNVEACKEDPTISPLVQVPNSSGRPDRTGTWTFMSVKVQDADPHLHTVQDDLEALFWVGLYMIALYMPIPEATAIAIVDELFQSYTFRGGVPVGGDTKRSFLSGSRNFELEPSLESACPALTTWLRYYKKLTGDWLRYLTARETYTPAPLLDDAPPAPTDLHDYDKLDQIWRRILDHGVFMDNDRLNDPDHKRDPFHVTAVYRKSLAKEADRQVELQASARFTLAESQRAEAEARRAEMQRGNPKASIELGLSQNSGADASRGDILLKRSAVMKADKEDNGGKEGAHNDSRNEQVDEENEVFGF
ncbi:hypothetical protein K523DRAFT_410688 [Schizophyllum commune Tattone D]|nr:hypothetical protein K523DRAFT_410688 [Schizophyllum commune Tattone D]